MSSVLSTGTSALLAFQRALATTSHNVANLNTPGYSRQKVDFATASPQNLGYGDIGNGTRITDIRRTADQLAISRLLDSSGELARLKQLSGMADRVNSLFSDAATNVSGVWSKFFDSVSGLSSNAAGTADRQNMLDGGKALANRFVQLNTHLNNLNSEVNNGLLAGATEVNRLAVSKPITWFEQNLISHVPLPHTGFMRRVYPGFVQLSAFMSMNPERHKQSFVHLYEHLEHGRLEEAATIQNFYEEYLAVNDLPAEFYLETVEKVFQTYDLPRGVLTYQGRTVNPAAIRRTALMTVEGERDDICSVGQTVAAQDLCTSVRPYLKTHHIQTGVGHYGVFSGRKWNQQIYPRVRDHVHAAEG